MDEVSTRPTGVARWAWGSGVVVAVAAAATLVWALAGGGPFWPRWAMFGIVVAAALGLGVERTATRAPGSGRRLAVHRALTRVLIPAEIVIWVLAGRGFFWPLWPIVGFLALYAAHWLWERREAERALSERVRQLTRTRSRALDTQAAELRRIERDLHDGAQARLVAAGMTIGLAEQVLRSDPDEAAQLLAEARQATVTAIDELRAVMRGIQPPVLADRGLLGAVEALALDLGLRLDVSGHATPAMARLPAPVQAATYFAVAECLTNVARHSGTREAQLRLLQSAGVLRIVVQDEGDGGAAIRPGITGGPGGSGLAGIGERLAAFDGRIDIDSPAGGPTVVTLEIPCAS